MSVWVGVLAGVGLRGEELELAAPGLLSVWLAFSLFRRKFAGVNLAPSSGDAVGRPGLHHLPLRQEPLACTFRSWTSSRLSAAVCARAGQSNQAVMTG